MRRHISRQGAIFLALTGTAAQAQIVAPMAPVPTKADTGNQLSDIIVTAQKRSERLQDVPISIAAVSANQLNSRGVTSIRDLQVTVPGFQFNAVAGDPQIFLRGVGTDVTQPNADPSVAPYVDGVFIGFSKGVDFNLFGIDRVEVLKGPQGTLFGRNAVGGAVNFIMRTPGPSFSANASLTAGDYSLRQFTGYVETPVTNDLAIGLYGYTERRDPYTNFIYSTASAARRTPAKVAKDGIRAKVAYASGPVKLTASYEYLQSKTPENAALRQIDRNALGFAAGADVVLSPYKQSTDLGSPSRTFVHTGIVREEVDLGGPSLIGITGYRNTRDYSTADFDGTDANLIGFAGSPAHSSQVSQELQILSPVHQRFTWIAGVYYYHDTGGFSPQTIITGPALSPVVNFDKTWTNVRTNSEAVFAQGTYELVNGLKLTAGGRYTWDAKVYHGSEGYFDSSDKLVSPIIIYPRNNKNWKQFTPKIGLDYKVGGLLLYASYSRGYKAGVYNIASASTPGPVNPEKLTAYEAGFKWTISRGLNIDAGAYHYDFTNLQVQVVSPNGNGTTNLQNAASAKIYGAEASLDAVLAKGLQANAAVAYNHARYGKFANFLGFAPGTNTSALIDASNNVVQRAPKWTITAGLSYHTELGNAGALELNGNWYHNSGFYWDPSNSSDLRQNSYDIVNASAAYLLPGNKIKATVWVRNLADKYYNSFMIKSVFGTDVIDAPPRTFGVTLSYTY